MKPKIGKLVYLKYVHERQEYSNHYLLKITKIKWKDKKWYFQGEILWLNHPMNSLKIGYNNTHSNSYFCAYDEYNIYKANIPIMNILVMEAL